MNLKKLMGHNEVSGKKEIAPEFSLFKVTLYTECNSETALIIITRKKTPHLTIPFRCTHLEF